VLRILHKWCSSPNVSVHHICRIIMYIDSLWKWVTFYSKYIWVQTAYERSSFLRFRRNRITELCCGAELCQSYHLSNAYVCGNPQLFPWKPRNSYSLCIATYVANLRSSLNVPQRRSAGGGCSKSSTRFFYPNNLLDIAIHGDVAVDFDNGHYHQT